MRRAIVNRAVGAALLALYVILVGGCGSGGQEAQVLSDTGTARGVVLDQRSGVPLADARVRVGSIVTHVNKAGAFVMVVPTGTHERTVTADGYETLSDTVTIIMGDNDLGAARLFELPPPPPQF